MIQNFMGSMAVSAPILLVCLLYLLVTRVLRRPISIEGSPITVWILDILIWPLGIIASFTVLQQIFSMIGSTDAIVQLQHLKSFMMHIAFFWLAARGVDLIFLRWYVFHRTGFTTPALLRGLCYAIFVIAGISLFLFRIGYPITGFLVSTGLVAGIVGLALQGTLSDLFSGFALSLDKPFHIGEWIELEDETVGQVVDITWRSTRLTTFNNTLLSVPNSVMAKSAIVNLDAPDRSYAVWYRVKISSEVDPKLVVTVISTCCAFG